MIGRDALHAARFGILPHDLANLACHTGCISINQFVDYIFMLLSVLIDDGRYLLAGEAPIVDLFPHGIIKDEKHQVGIVLHVRRHELHQPMTCPLSLQQKRTKTNINNED